MEEQKEQHRLKCPARDKVDDKRYGKAFFLHESGSAIKAKACMGKCKYMAGFNKKGK